MIQYDGMAPIKLEACAYVCFSLSYTELTADQFSARVVCQSTGYSSMRCAQKDIPTDSGISALTRLEDGIRLLSDHTRLVEGLPDSRRDNADQTCCGPTQSLLHKGHRGLLTSGCEASEA